MYICTVCRPEGLFVCWFVGLWQLWYKYYKHWCTNRCKYFPNIFKHPWENFPKSVVPKSTPILQKSRNVNSFWRSWGAGPAGRFWDRLKSEIDLFGDQSRKIGSQLKVLPNIIFFLFLGNLDTKPQNKFRLGGRSKFQKKAKRHILFHENRKKIDFQVWSTKRRFFEV